MNMSVMRRLLGCAAMFYASLAAGSPATSFGVIAPAIPGANGEAVLQYAIAETDADNLAFVVAMGIKAPEEPCSDGVYQRRKALLDRAKNGLVVLLSGADWTGCRHSNGKSAAIGRLNRLRELFFTDEFSIGASRIPLTRQSANPKFRNYGENARWEIDDVMFATINLPSANNHYLSEAGRNNEFEDRVVATREWLHRLFTHAGRRKMAAVVLFSDGNPYAANRNVVRRDGFAEVRQQLQALAQKFPGKVLVVHAGSANDAIPAIAWRGNLGLLQTDAPWTKITVTPDVQTMFVVEARSVQIKSPNE